MKFTLATLAVAAMAFSSVATAAAIPRDHAEDVTAAITPRDSDPVAHADGEVTCWYDPINNSDANALDQDSILNAAWDFCNTEDGSPLERNWSRYHIGGTQVQLFVAVYGGTGFTNCASSIIKIVRKCGSRGGQVTVGYEQYRVDEKPE